MSTTPEPAAADSAPSKPAASDAATPPGPSSAVSPGARRFLLVWLALNCVVVLSHFVFFRQMGFYEDDHALIGVVMCNPKSHGSHRDLRHWAGPYYQGRPLHFVIGAKLAYLTTHHGGVPAAYLLAAAVWMFNAGLVLALLWRPFGPFPAALGALFYVLFPTDTTHSLLHAAFFVQPSATFLLLSGLAYSRGWTFLAVIPAALTLATYETFFLPALAWPLLFPPAARWVNWRGVLYLLALLLVLGLAFVARGRLGEERVTGAMQDKRALAKKAVELATDGPEISLKTWKSRPEYALRMWNAPNPFRTPEPAPGLLLGVAVAAGLGALGAMVLARAAPAGPLSLGAHGRMAVVGLAMVSISYAMAINRSPGVIAGRLSTVHSAAALGWAICLAGIASGAVSAFGRWRAQYALVPALAVYLGLLAGFHVLVQRDYIRAWNAQMEFWTDVVAECPDVGPGTVILYPLFKPKTQMILSQEWADHMVFRHLFRVPPGWAEPPRVYPAGHWRWGTVPDDFEGYDWTKEIEYREGMFVWKHWAGERTLLQPGNVIIMRRTPEGRFERMTGAIRVDGRELQLKPRGGPAFDFEPNKLYPAMFPHGVQAESGRRVSR